ncbi:hypothetical protein DV096_09885 [Bradymonadaceae bacterium TMQ3]|nr:hypothetical protein DV096_09885 [Bradymonadaceae bacterium TMQ3]
MEREEGRFVVVWLRGARVGRFVRALGGVRFVVVWLRGSGGARGGEVCGCVVEGLWWGARRGGLGVRWGAREFDDGCEFGGWEVTVGRLVASVYAVER